MSQCKKEKRERGKRGRKKERRRGREGVTTDEHGWTQINVR
jgi:hypothetical protein